MVCGRGSVVHKVTNCVNIRSGFVESRVIDFVLQLEDLFKHKVAIHPFQHRIPAGELSTYFVIGIDAPRAQCEEIARQIANSLNFEAFRGPIVEPGMLINVDVSNDVTTILKEAKNLVDNAVIPLQEFEYVELSIPKVAANRAPVRVEQDGAGVVGVPLRPGVVNGNNYADATRKKDQERGKGKGKNKQNKEEDGI